MHIYVCVCIYPQVPIKPVPITDDSTEVLQMGTRTCAHHAACVKFMDLAVHYIYIYIYIHIIVWYIISYYSILHHSISISAPTKPLLAAETTLLPIRWVRYRYCPCISTLP